MNALLSLNPEELTWRGRGVERPVREVVHSKLEDTS